MVGGSEQILAQIGLSKQHFNMTDVLIKAAGFTHRKPLIITWVTPITGWLGWVVLVRRSVVELYVNDCTWFGEW